MKITQHPLWLVGFRPFFALAALSGLALPVLWVLIFSGKLPAEFASFSPIQWHAHEMFFGFGWAVLGGFLLTATKNWVKIRGYHGAVLVYLVTAWLCERAGMWFASELPAPLFLLASNLFLLSIVVLLLWSLIRHRAQDSYPDNYFFLIALPLFLVAKNLMLSADYFALGTNMTLALFRLAFLVMLERTLTQFMKGVFGVDILRNVHLDRTIKQIGALLIIAAFLPAPFAAWMQLALAVLLTVRLAFWKPHLALRRIDTGIMIAGYLAIVAQLLLEFLATMADVHWIGTLSVHVFTLGAMGLVIPAMLIRIAKGHTGRKVTFDWLDKAVLWIMVVAFVSRVVAPQIAPERYLDSIYLAAAGWCAGFSIFAWRYIPYLMKARIDGKES